jgi:hypothetical protein
MLPLCMTCYYLVARGSIGQPYAAVRPIPKRGHVWDYAGSATVIPRPGRISLVVGGGKFLKVSFSVKGRME